MTKYTPAAFSLLILTGCASLSPTLPPATQPESNSAYIAGLFSTNKGAHFAFVIRSDDGKTEYVMPMGEDTALPTKLNDSSIAIKVLPGTYSIAQWITYGTLTKEVMSRKSAQNTPLSKPFTVEAGSVIHLGSFTTDWNFASSWFNGYAHQINFDARIYPVGSTKRAVQAAFAQAYPNLSTQPLACVFCSDTFVPEASK